MKNTLIVGLGAFGFAVAQYLSRIHPDRQFFAHERNQTIVESLRGTREHPYFFPGIQLSENIHIVDNIDDILHEVSIIIVVIPTPYIRDFFRSHSAYIKKGTLVINCSKGIDNENLETVSAIMDTILGEGFCHYAVLSGGMMADELIAGVTLGATIGASDDIHGMIAHDIFSSQNLAIELTLGYRDVELLGSLKNIFALYVGYLEGQGHKSSSIGFGITCLYKELPELLLLLGGSGNIDFGSYALGGDLIATCFGESRNRYLGRLVGTGISPTQALSILQSEKKHAEGYETLRGLVPIIEKSNLPFFQKIVGAFYPNNNFDYYISIKN